MRSSQSRELLWEKCNRAYFWRYVCDLEGRIPSGKAWIGQAVHEALRVHYTGGNEATVLAAYDAKMAAFPEQMQEDFGKLRPVYRARVQAYGRAMAAQDAGLEVVLAPEQELELKVSDEHTMLVILDLIVREKRTGALWVMDHKTTGRTGMDWWAQYYIDKQGSAYTLAAEQALGEEVMGFIVNAIKPTKEGWFERQAFTRTRGDLESFQRQTAHALDRRAKLPVMKGMELERKVTANLLQDEHYPQTTAACHLFGNCVYLGMCRAGRAALGLYKKREASGVDRDGGGVAGGAALVVGEV